MYLILWYYKSWIPYKFYFIIKFIFEIALKNFKKFKYIILFLGKSGKEILKEASKKWKFDYEEKKSLTSDESVVVKISNLQKKNG